MPQIYKLSVFRHPVRAAGLTLRRAVLRGLRALQLRWDHTATNPHTGDFDGGDLPTCLQHFSEGEILPWKGVKFKVGKVVGGELPCIMLVPIDATKGTKLRTLRMFRDRVREVRRVS